MAFAFSLKVPANADAAVNVTESLECMDIKLFSTIRITYTGTNGHRQNRHSNNACAHASAALQFLKG